MSSKNNVKNPTSESIQKNLNSNKGSIKTGIDSIKSKKFNNEFVKNLKKYIFHPASFTALIIVTAILGIVLFVNFSKPQLDKTSVQKQTWFWGNENSDIVVTVYSDFQCPACGTFFSTVEQDLKNTYKDDIKFIHKHYPLREIHPRAQLAAEASEAAGAQGKFWEYHDLLYSRQSEDSARWSVDVFTDYAKEVGVPDVERFKIELRGDLYEDIVNQDYEEAFSKKIGGTPTAFVNDVQVKDSSFASIAVEIDKLLDDKKQE